MLLKGLGAALSSPGNDKAGTGHAPVVACGKGLNFASAY